MFSCTDLPVQSTKPLNRNKTLSYCCSGSCECCMLLPFKLQALCSLTARVCCLLPVLEFLSHPLKFIFEATDCVVFSRIWRGRGDTASQAMVPSICLSYKGPIALSLVQHASQKLGMVQGPQRQADSQGSPAGPLAAGQQLGEEPGPAP